MNLPQTAVHKLNPGTVVTVRGPKDLSFTAGAESDAFYAAFYLVLFCFIAGQETVLKIEVIQNEASRMKLAE